MVGEFQASLSDDGFFVGIDETNRVLPNGDLVRSGM
jgi:hypothetical protein